MMHRYATLGETVYFWFAANDTGGSGADGATPVADVRLAGAAADAAPVYSPTPALLTHENYPAGCHELAVAATQGNGFAAGNTYAVFCTLLVDSQNPSGFIGAFTLDVPSANVAEILGTALTETQTGYLAAAFKKFLDVATPLLDCSAAMRGTDGAYTGTPPTADAIGTDAAGKVLATPANKLATNGSGYVTYANAAPPSAPAIAGAVLDEAKGSHAGFLTTLALEAGGNVAAILAIQKGDTYIYDEGGVRKVKVTQAGTPATVLVPAKALNDIDGAAITDDTGVIAQEVHIP